MACWFQVGGLGHSFGCKLGFLGVLGDLGPKMTQEGSKSKTVQKT